MHYTSLIMQYAKISFSQSTKMNHNQSILHFQVVQKNEDK